MKKQSISFLFAVVAFVSFSVFTSCSSDDDNSSDGLKYNVVGTWDLKEFKIQDMWINVADRGYYVTFGEDGEYHGYYLDVETSGTYVYDGHDEIVVTSGDTRNFIKIHSLKGNKAEAELYDDANPEEKVEFRFERQ